LSSVEHRAQYRRGHPGESRKLVRLTTDDRRSSKTTEGRQRPVRKLLSDAWVDGEDPNRSRVPRAGQARPPATPTRTSAIPINSRPVGYSR